MSALDVKQAKQALGWRLADWGVEDAHAKAAGFIDDLVGQGWQMSPDRESRPRPPRPQDACRTCGRHVDRCDCKGGPTRRPLKPNSNGVAHLRALRDEATAELCSHGMPRTNCLAHPGEPQAVKTEPSDQPSEEQE